MGATFSSPGFAVWDLINHEELLQVTCLWRHHLYGMFHCTSLHIRELVEGGEYLEAALS